MGAHLFTKRLATGLVLALSSVFAAQTVSAVSEGSLHPSWSDSAMAEGWRAVCGDVRNVGPVPARSVAIRVLSRSRPPARADRGGARCVFAGSVGRPGGWLVGSAVGVGHYSGGGGLSSPNALPQQPVVHTTLGHPFEVALFPLGVGIEERIVALPPELLGQALGRRPQPPPPANRHDHDAESGVPRVWYRGGREIMNAEQQKRLGAEIARWSDGRVTMDEHGVFVMQHEDDNMTRDRWNDFMAVLREREPAIWSEVVEWVTWPMSQEPES